VAIASAQSTHVTSNTLIGKPTMTTLACPLRISHLWCREGFGLVTCSPWGNTDQSLLPTNQTARSTPEQATHATHRAGNSWPTCPGVGSVPFQLPVVRFWLTTKPRRFESMEFVYSRIRARAWRPAPQGLPRRCATHDGLPARCRGSVALAALAALNLLRTE
jgi:hypothetical protein